MTLNITHARQLSDTFAALDLGDQVLDEPRALLHRAEELAREARTRPAEVADHLAELAGKLATGDAKVAHVVKQVATMQTESASVDAVRTVLRQAQATAEQAAYAAFRNAGDPLLDVLDDAIRELADTAGGLADLVDGIETDRDALKAPPAALGAWQTLADLTNRYAAIRAAAGMLRGRGFATMERGRPKRRDTISNAATKPINGADLNFEYPWQAKYVPGGAHPVRHLLAVAECGPRELRWSRYLDDLPRLDAGHDAAEEAAMLEQRGQRDEARAVWAELLAASVERRARRDAEQNAA